MLGQYFGDLPAPVGPEIKTDHHVAFRYGGHRLTVILHHYHRLEKLISYLCPVRSLQGGRYFRCGHIGLAIAFDHGLIGQAHPVPALITVHGIIPPDQRGDLRIFSLQMLL
ncbi:hypothetical protein FQZ97_1168850 [compost metagenome]